MKLCFKNLKSVLILILILFNYAILTNENIYNKNYLSNLNSNNYKINQNQNYNYNNNYYYSSLVNNADRNIIKNRFNSNFNFSQVNNNAKNLNLFTLLNNAYSNNNNPLNNDDYANNSYIMNTVVNSENYEETKIEDDEQEVKPMKATSIDHYKKSTLMGNIDFSPNNCIKNNSLSWKSQPTDEEELTFVFNDVTKLDKMTIHWINHPTTFQIFVKTSEDDKKDAIPATNVNRLYEPYGSHGEKKPQESVSKYTLIKFNQSLHVKLLSIKMNRPLNNIFEVGKVKFFNQKTLVQIYNQTSCKCNNYCLYVNTNKPIEYDKIVGIDCNEAAYLSNLNELFYYGSDYTIKPKWDQKLLVGINDVYSMSTEKSDTNLKLFKDINSNLKIGHNDDGSIYFARTPELCVYIDKTRKELENYGNHNTSVDAPSDFSQVTSKFQNVFGKLI